MYNFEFQISLYGKILITPYHLLRWYPWKLATDYRITGFLKAEISLGLINTSQRCWKYYDYFLAKSQTEAELIIIFIKNFWTWKLNFECFKNYANDKFISKYKLNLAQIWRCLLFIGKFTHLLFLKTVAHQSYKKFLKNLLSMKCLK